MGQEVAVTPLQLVDMVSTIANGGMFLPPHILLKTSAQAEDDKLTPVAFHPEHQLVEPLPKGAHRVISTLTAAQMRNMMEGVVMDGTGKNAQLNGYSAAGKTGTAQKIDPKTHTYSKRNYVASFAGFAPVNDPAISIVVTMDSPQYSMHYGASASAPAFHRLAQQILEYLGVPHDQPLKTPKEMLAIEKQPVRGDAPQHLDNLSSLFAEINNLPEDDPLRNPSAGTNAKAAADEAKAYDAGISGDGSGPDDSEEAVQDSSQPAPAQPKSGRPGLANKSAPEPTAAPPSARPDLEAQPAAAKRSLVAMPQLVGKPMREAISTAANVGLNVHVSGSGTATAQAPAAGTRIPAGTTIVVRFQ
jgi:cell division protein FtsI (penicillin-binding protein 3)